MLILSEARTPWQSKPHPVDSKHGSTSVKVISSQVTLSAPPVKAGAGSVTGRRAGRRQSTNQTNLKVGVFSDKAHPGRPGPDSPVITTVHSLNVSPWQRSTSLSQTGTFGVHQQQRRLRSLGPRHDVFNQHGLCTSGLQPRVSRSGSASQSACCLLQEPTSAERAGNLHAGLVFLLVSLFGRLSQYRFRHTFEA